MKKFIIKTTLLLSIILFFLILGLILPPTPKAKDSYLMGKIKKDSLLIHVKQPRIIFVGGSNLAFGLDSQTLKDSLNFTPINTATHATIGLVYMMQDVKQFIQKNDIIIIAPEYQHFFGDFASGKEELLRTIFDTSNDSDFFYLKFQQYKNLINFIPKYAVSKFDVSQYYSISKNELYYTKAAFNNFGDVYLHWDIKKKTIIKPYNEILNEDFNNDIIEEISNFNLFVISKKAKLFITYPSFQASSYKNCIKQIEQVDNKLKKMNIKLLGTAFRYTFADSLMFDSPYHLTKNGVDIRTQLLIEDLNLALKK